jgi:hypothetical protein
MASNNAGAIVLSAGFSFPNCRAVQRLTLCARTFLIVWHSTREKARSLAVGNGLFYYLRPHGIAGNPRGITYIKKTDRQIRDEGWGEMEAGGKYVTDLLKLMRRVWNPETREWLRVREELDRKRRR